MHRLSSEQNNAHLIAHLLLAPSTNADGQGLAPHTKRMRVPLTVIRRSLLEHSLMVGQQILILSVLVRLQVLQPISPKYKGAVQKSAEASLSAVNNRVCHWTRRNPSDYLWITNVCRETTVSTYHL